MSLTLDVPDMKRRDVEFAKQSVRKNYFYQAFRNLSSYRCALLLMLHLVIIYVDRAAPPRRNAGLAFKKLSMDPFLQFSKKRVKTLADRITSWFRFHIKIFLPGSI